MQNLDKLPHFKCHFTNPHHELFGCIEAEGIVIHHVRYLDEFYSTFGYTAEMGKSGLLPEEFIWDEYIKDNCAVTFSTCMQIHTVEYLMLHDAAFREKFGEKCQSLIAAHAVEKLTNTAACAACRLKPYCGK